MKAQATSEFFDIEAMKVRKPGDEFEAGEERIKHLEALGLVKPAAAARKTATKAKATK